MRRDCAETRVQRRAAGSAGSETTIRSFRPFPEHRRPSSPVAPSLFRASVNPSALRLRRYGFIQHDPMHLQTLAIISEPTR